MADDISTINIDVCSDCSTYPYCHYPSSRLNNTSINK